MANPHWDAALVYWDDPDEVWDGGTSTVYSITHQAPTFTFTGGNHTFTKNLTIATVTPTVAFVGGNHTMVYNPAPSAGSHYGEATYGESIYGVVPTVTITTMTHTAPTLTFIGGDHTLLLERLGAHTAGHMTFTGGHHTMTYIPVIPVEPGEGWGFGEWGDFPWGDGPAPPIPSVGSIEQFSDQPARRSIRHRDIHLPAPRPPLTKTRR